MSKSLLQPSANEAIHTHEYIELDGQRIEWVKNFKYLGSMVASSETDIRARKGQAWGAFWKMKDIFRSNYNIYPNYIAKLINSEIPPTIDEIRASAKNRQGWRMIVDACIPTSFAVD